VRDPPLILVVDDNGDNREILEARLASQGYATAAAADGEEALAAVHELLPDLILLDVMMPKVSGFEVCRRLRADPATRGVSVLMVTALDQATDVETAVEAGTDDFITKPINKTELLLRVRAMLDSRREAAEPDRALAYIGRVQQGL
jgi:two-component system, OmpR family, alkaline phosphatase synthesis response regulator PhoP